MCFGVFQQPVIIYSYQNYSNRLPLQKGKNDISRLGSIRIAASAIQYSLNIVTTDRHYLQIPLFLVEIPSYHVASRKVGLVTKESLSPSLKPYIVKEVKYVLTLIPAAYS